MWPRATSSSCEQVKGSAACISDIFDTHPRRQWLNAVSIYWAQEPVGCLDGSAVLAGLGHMPGSQLAISWSKTTLAPTAEMTGSRGSRVSYSRRLAQACSSWWWLKWKSGNKNTQGFFQASVWVTFANIPIAKETHMAKLRTKGQGNRSYLFIERNETLNSHGKGGWIQREKLELLMQSICCIMATNSLTRTTG